MARGRRNLCAMIKRLGIENPWKIVFVFYFIIIIFLAALRSTQDLSSPTRD